MYGLSGIGKSRCVQETLHQMAAEGLLAVSFPHGVWYVRMESIAGPGEAAGVIAGSLRAPIRSTGMEHGLVDYLRPRSLLLWLDGFDGMGPAIPLLRRLLQTAPGLKLLVTSHEKLLLEGEQAFELRGLATASPDGAQFSPAELLFLQYVRPGNGRLSAEETQALHKICTAVDGHPLGLILTATASQYFTFSQIAHELNRGLSLFSATQRDIPPRHRTFHALFQNLWRLWSGEDRTLALQLAVFHEGFTLAGAVDVSGVLPARIGELVDRGVIERVVVDDSTGVADEGIRYRLHPIVFPFVRDMLFAQPELLIPLRERHATHIARFVRRQTLHLGTAAAARGLDALALEWPNLVAAWRYGVQMQRVAILAEMAEGLFAYLVNRGPYSDGVRLTNLAIDWLRSTTELSIDAIKGQQLVASLYVGLATLHSRRADFGAALEAAKLALAMEQKIGDLRVRALAQLELGRAYFWTAHYREATPALEAARHLAKELDDPRHKIRTDATVASLMIFSGDHQKGAALFMQALAHAQSGGYVIEEAQVLAGLATVSYYAGQYAVCEELSTKAEGLYQALGDLSGVANCVMNRANVLQQVGRFGGAQEGYLRALAISRKTEDVAREVMMLANLGLNAYHRHDQRLALDYLSQAANLAQGSDMRDFQAFIALCRGHALTALHEHADALQWYESALALRRALGQRQQTAEPLAGLIELSLQMGDQRVAGQLAGDLYQLVSKADFQAAVELFRVYWACFAGLRTVADERARGVLETAYRRLESRAAQIGDEAMRQDFYTRVEAHRNILAAWGSLQSDRAS
jgi:predicted ATPase